MAYLQKKNLYKKRYLHLHIKNIYITVFIWNKSYCSLLQILYAEFSKFHRYLFTETFELTYYRKEYICEIAEQIFALIIWNISLI